MLSISLLVSAASVVANSPLKDRSFTWLPITDIRPLGWLKAQETIQAETLGGHLHEFFNGVKGSVWIGGNLTASGLAEETPYWLNGIVPLSIQLDDQRLLGVVHRYITAILDRQRPDGWLGPYEEGDDPTQTPWSRYRMLTVLSEYADLPNADPRTVSAMHNLTHRLHEDLLSMSENDLRNRFPWAHARWHEFVANIQGMIDRDPDDKFGDQALLMKAMQTARKKGLDWHSWYASRLCENATDSECFPCRQTRSAKCKYADAEYFCEHGVNVAQSLHIWGLDYRLGDQGAADRAEKGLRRLDYCHGQPGSIFSAHEVMDGIDTNRGSETCHVVELMNNYAQLFSYFGDVTYLDRVEAAAFNRLPAPYFNGSMWALQYHHQTNAFRPCLGYGLPFECCVVNGNQGWPKLTSHLYAKSPDDGLVAALYAPSDVEAMVGGGKVRVQLDTTYPFGEVLDFSIDAERGFPLRLRIPGWAVDATISVNGGAMQSVGNGTLHLVSIKAGKSSVRLVLPMAVRIEQSAEDVEGVVVKAGALLFALDLEPEEEKSDQCYFPPEGCHVDKVQGTLDWRRALLLDPTEPAGGLKLVRRPASGAPFGRHGAGLVIQAKALPLPASVWPTVRCTGQEDGCHDCIGPTPTEQMVHDHAVLEPEIVTLMPFGATDVRVTVLPATWRTPSPVPPPPPTPPAPTPPATCEERCAAAGHCCAGAVSSWQHPSCAMGCTIAKHTESVSDCEGVCHANDNTCGWSIAGIDMNNCLHCPSGCDASAGVDECIEGCRNSFNGAWLFEADGPGKLFLSEERFAPNEFSSREGALAWDACSGGDATFDNGNPIWIVGKGSKVGAVSATGSWALRWSSSCGRSTNFVEIITSDLVEGVDGRTPAEGLVYLEVEDSVSRMYI